MADPKKSKAADSVSIYWISFPHHPIFTPFANLPFVNSFCIYVQIKKIKLALAKSDIHFGLLIAISQQCDHILYNSEIKQLKCVGENFDCFYLRRNTDWNSWYVMLQEISTICVWNHLCNSLNLSKMRWQRIWRSTLVSHFLLLTFFFSWSFRLIFDLSEFNLQTLLRNYHVPIENAFHIVRPFLSQVFLSTLLLGEW